MISRKALRRLALSMTVLVLISSSRAFAEEDISGDKVVTESEDKTVDTEEPKDKETKTETDTDTKKETKAETKTESKTKSDKESENESDEEVTDESLEETDEASLLVEEEENPEEDKVELENKELTGKVGNHKIIISGKMPAGAEVSIKENSDYEAATAKVEKGLPSKMGFYEIVSFDIEFSYVEEGETKQFVPSDFEETYTVTVKKIGRSEAVSAYSISDDSKSLSASGTDEAIFSLKDESSVTVGITYECNGAICGRAPGGEANLTVCALGNRVKYTTKSDSRGNYLITGVDYSKAHAGCCYEIITE